MTEFEAVGVFENASHPPSQRIANRSTIPAQTGFWEALKMRFWTSCRITGSYAQKPAGRSTSSPDLLKLALMGWSPHGLGNAPRLFKANAVQIVIGVAAICRQHSRERCEQDRVIRESHKHILLRICGTHAKSEQTVTGVSEFACPI